MSEGRIDRPHAGLQDAVLLRMLHAPGCGLQTLAVYHVINRLRHTRRENPSKADIARMLGIKRQRVVGAFRWLEDNGLIETDSEGRWKCVKLDPIDLSDTSFDRTPTPTPPSAKSERSTVRKANGTACARSTVRRTVQRSKANGTAFASPYRRDGDLGDPSSVEVGSGSRAHATPGPVEEEGNQDAEVSEFEWHRHRVQDLSADPVDPWVRFAVPPTPAFRARLQEWGFVLRVQQSPRHPVTGETLGGTSYTWEASCPATAARCLAVVRRLAADVDGVREVEADDATIIEPVASPDPSSNTLAATTDPELAALWAATRAELERQLDAQFFESHFAAFVVTGSEGDALTITSPDEMAAILVDKNYRELIERCAQRATGRRLRVRVVTEFGDGRRRSA